MYWEENIVFGRGENENECGECVSGGRNIRSMERSLTVKQGGLLDCIALGNKEFLVKWAMLCIGVQEFTVD